MSGVLVLLQCRDVCSSADNTSFEKPDDVSMEELSSVNLGEGVAFDVQPNWE